MAIRTRRYLITALYHLVIVALTGGGVWLGLHLRHQLLFDLSGIGLFLHLFTCRRNPFLTFVLHRCIRWHSCWSCGWTIPLLASWACRCRYVSTRHCLSRCPSCGKGFRYISCRCGTGVLV